MFLKFLESEHFHFLMAVADLYDKEMSVEEIASKMRIEEELVREAIETICMAREVYRQNHF